MTGQFAGIENFSYSEKSLILRCEFSLLNVDHLYKFNAQITTDAIEKKGNTQILG